MLRAAFTTAMRRKRSGNERPSEPCFRRRRLEEGRRGRPRAHSASPIDHHVAHPEDRGRAVARRPPGRRSGRRRTTMPRRCMTISDLAAPGGREPAQRHPVLPLGRLRLVRRVQGSARDDADRRRRLSQKRPRVSTTTPANSRRSVMMHAANAIRDCLEQLDTARGRAGDRRDRRLQPARHLRSGRRLGEPRGGREAALLPPRPSGLRLLRRPPAAHVGLDACGRATSPSRSPTAAGRSPVVGAIEIARSYGATTIALTRPGTPLAEAAEIVIPVAIAEDANALMPTRVALRAYGGDRYDRHRRRRRDGRAIARVAAASALHAREHRRRDSELRRRIQCR